MKSLRLTLARLLAPKEFAELQRWHGYSSMYEGWLKEFPAVHKAIVNLRSAVRSDPESLNNESHLLPGPYSIIKLRDYLRHNYGQSNHKQD
jgi:hypothetical protein